MSEDDGVPASEPERSEARPVRGSRPPRSSRPSRRELLGGAIGVAAGAAAASGVALGVGAASSPTPRPTASASAGAAVLATGAHQAGVQTPTTPQRFGRVAVLALEDVTDRSFLAGVGRRILALTRGQDVAAMLPDGPGDLTVTVGLGPRVIAAVDPALPGATAMPAFAGDDAIDDRHLGGDVLLGVYSSDPTVLEAVVDDLVARIPGASRQWEQMLFRGPGTGPKARNPMGFFDSVVVPHGDAEFDENVWIADGVLAGGTICCIRRFSIDVARFRAMSVADREAVFGRHLADGSPLSGGGPDAQIDTEAKTAEGEFVVPAHAHARAAHPSFTGSALMLRRSYSFEDDTATGSTQGLVFISFQHDLRTFVATQQRLDDIDALMPFTTPTATASFVILPGFDDARPLGSTLA